MLEMKSSVFRVEEQLIELKSKYSLLEGDRRAYYETSQKAIKDNKERIYEYRHQNKEIRKALSHLSRLYGTDKDSPDQGKRSNLEHMDERLSQLRNKENLLRYQIAKKLEEMQNLANLFNKMKESEKTIFTRNIDPKHESSQMQQAQQLRSLENRLDKAKIKYHEARSISKTYYKLHNQLSKDVLLYNNHIDGLQELIYAQKQELHALTVMGSDAIAAKEKGKSELAATEQILNEQRKVQEKVLNDLKQKVANQMELHDKIEKRQQKLRESFDNPNSELNEQEAVMEKETKIASYEEAMRKIKDATGVTDISEVIEKLLSQENTQEHLSRLQGDCEKKIVELTEEKDKQQKVIHDLKYTGEGQGSSMGRIIDEFDERMQEATGKLKEAKIRAERSVELSRAASLGVQHLADKLEHVVLVS